jgi:hypothetical protein
MRTISDMYDLLPPDRGRAAPAQQGAPAELEALGTERRERLADVLGDAAPAASPE